MCGIAGIIELQNRQIDPDVLVRMTDEIVHRGPDGEGYLFSNNESYCEQLKLKRPGSIVISKKHHASLAFGHRRLSILDLSSSAGQPMVEASNRYWIIYNGEIYNHSDLRKELKTLGYQFKTDHSDTEVILNAYACWGVSCLQRFNGMWSFCIWDSERDTFFISRDRAGKKPLFYTEHKGCFYFSSEMKAILTNRDIPRELSEHAIYDYLTYMMVPAPETIFKNIFKLPAAHYLLFKAGEKPHPVRYWTPFTEEPDLEPNENEIIEGIRERIFEASRLRMIADVEVGVLLSGGIDSSINLAALSRYATRPIKAFSVGFVNKHGYKNEFEFARKVAAQFKAEYHELTITENDFLEFFPQMIRYQGEPIADTANIPIYYIAKAARETGVKVLLGGEGSDELFVGYELWKLSRQFARLMEGKPRLASMMQFIQRNSPARLRRVFYYSWYEKIKKGQPVFWSGTELRSEKAKISILSSDFLMRIGSYNSFDPMCKWYAEYKHYGGDRYKWMTASDLQFRLPDLLLARLDRMLMAASVEGRNPFLDVNVIEYAMRIPASLKTNKNEEKYILKKAFEGILPDEIIYRPKDSFTVPITRLFDNKNFKGMALSAISRFNDTTGIFTPKYLDSLNQNSNSAELWNVANLALWHDQYK